MSAQIINLADVRANRSDVKQNRQMVSSGGTLRIDLSSVEKNQIERTPRFHFWTGASGQRYIHTIHSLMTCPALPASNYILVRVTEGQRREVLAIGRVDHPTPSLNLAEIRQRGASLGATEVHVHLLAVSETHSLEVTRDLRTAQFGASCPVN